MTMDRCVDINCDMGERPEALHDGSEEELMQLVTSANIACGYHAGNVSIMEQTVCLAVKFNVGIGAHPSYPDRKNFGRASMHLSMADVTRAVYEQIRILGDIAQARHSSLVHVKPHGALYYDAIHDTAIAQAIADGAAKWSKDLILIGLAGSVMLDVWEERGFFVAPEAFADRVYEKDGALRSRRLADALITGPAIAAQQAVNIVTKGSVIIAGGIEHPVRATTMCIHGDTPGAIEIARAVRQKMEEAGITIQGLKFQRRSGS